MESLSIEFLKNHKGEGTASKANKKRARSTGNPGLQSAFVFNLQKKQQLSCVFKLAVV